MTQIDTHLARLLRPEQLVGTWRRFGAAGLVYEIIGTDGELAGGDRMMRVRVLESGEEFEKYTAVRYRGRPERALMFAIAFDLVVAEAAQHHLDELPPVPRHDVLGA